MPQTYRWIVVVTNPPLPMQESGFGPWVGRSPLEEGLGKALQYSNLWTEEPGGCSPQSQTRLKRLSTHAAPSPGRLPMSWPGWVQSHSLQGYKSGYGVHFTFAP